MISGISALPGFEETSLYVGKTEQDLGRDDFLTMFLAQLNHQDPLNPMDSTEFSSQLAQFSSLEQLFNVNANLETLKSAQDSGNRYQALSMIGKVIEAEGNVISLEPGEFSYGSFTLEDEAECAVLISDQEGYPVRELSLGLLEAGEHSFQWNGQDGEGNDLDRGIYVFEVMAVTPSGELLSVETKVKGTGKQNQSEQ